MQLTREIIPHKSHARVYRLAIIITIAGNILLASGKGIVAYFSGSAAIYADAANSISDVIYSLLMALGLYMAQKPPDLSHPQGHARFEPLIGIAVAASMAYAGYEALHSSIERLAVGGSAIALDLPVLVLIASALLKALMFFLVTRLAAKVNSPALRATAKDNLSDVLTSIAAFIGVLGSNLVHPWFDAGAGILVALWIFKAAFGVAQENLKYLTGAGASPEVREKIVQTVRQVDQVMDVHHLMTDYAGPQLVVDLHIDVDGEMSLNQAHTISDDVISAVESLPEVDRAYVHVEPWQRHQNTANQSGNK